MSCIDIEFLMSMHYSKSSAASVVRERKVMLKREFSRKYNKETFVSMLVDSYLGMRGRGLSTRLPADSEAQERRNLSVGHWLNTSNCRAIV